MELQRSGHRKGVHLFHKAISKFPQHERFTSPVGAKGDIEPSHGNPCNPVQAESNGVSSVGDQIVGVTVPLMRSISTVESSMIIFSDSSGRDPSQKMARATLNGRQTYTSESK